MDGTTVSPTEATYRSVSGIQKWPFASEGTTSDIGDLTSTPHAPPFSAPPNAYTGQMRGYNIGHQN